MGEGDGSAQPLVRCLVRYLVFNPVSTANQQSHDPELSSTQILTSIDQSD